MDKLKTNRITFSRIRASLVLLFTIALLCACSLVELTPHGEKARALNAEEVTRCKKVGQTTATVSHRVAGVPRRDSVITEELSILARNSSAEMGGDTIVPIGKHKEGKQSFTVYKCVP